MVRLVDKFAAVQNRQVLQAHLEPQQLALSPAGGHKLVHIVRMSMEAHHDWVCLKLDVENAHNSVSRASILEAVEEEQSLRHLAQHYAATSAAPTALESGGRVWGEAREALTQGRPGSSHNGSTSNRLPRTGAVCCQNSVQVLPPPPAG